MHKPMLRVNYQIIIVFRRLNYHLICVDFTYFLNFNTIFNLISSKKNKIESNHMSKKYNEIYQNSLKNPENFWQEVSNDIFWFKKPTKILNKSNPPFYKWFEDGVTNTCYNALDIHIDQGRGRQASFNL